MPRMSVVMPVLDGERYLPDTLTSLMAHLPKDAEVRVMDDGSTDATPRLLEEVAASDQRFIIHRHESPAGVHASLNELIAAGDSELVARMDADDIILPTRWRVTDAAMRNADFVFTSVVFINSDGKPRGVDHPGHFSAEATPYHLAYGSMLVHPTATFRRTAFEELGGYADTRAEDYELWMRAAVAGHRIVRTMTPGLKYRRHEEQVSLRRAWLAEHQESPLYPAYGALLDRLLGFRPEGWKTVFASALASSELTPEGAAQARALYDAVAGKASRTLSRRDAMLVSWRSHREGNRVDARSAARA